MINKILLDKLLIFHAHAWGNHPVRVKIDDDKQWPYIGGILNRSGYHCVLIDKFRDAYYFF